MLCITKKVSWFFHAYHAPDATRVWKKCDRDSSVLLGPGVWPVQRSSRIALRCSVWRKTGKCPERKPLAIILSFLVVSPNQNSLRRPQGRI